jgi:hypothetical protein
MFGITLKSKRDVNVEVYKKAIKFASQVNTTKVFFHDIASLDVDHILALIFTRDYVKKLTDTRDSTLV